MEKKNGSKEGFEVIGDGLHKYSSIDRYSHFRIFEIVKFKHLGIVTVLMEADDPYELLKDEARDAAKEKAEFEINSCCKFVDESLGDCKWTKSTSF